MLLEHSTTPFLRLWRLVTTRSSGTAKIPMRRSDATRGSSNRTPTAKWPAQTAHAAIAAVTARVKRASVRATPILAGSIAVVDVSAKLCCNRLRLASPLSFPFLQVTV